MPLTGEEIRRNLEGLVERWSAYQGTERAEAQTFLNELLACYGTNRSAVARFEEPTGGGFIDLIWPRVCIIEMKRPSQSARLSEHREQALEYWRNAGSPQAPAPRYVILCAFQTFEVWEPGAIYREPRATFQLEDLPDRLDALLFLAGREPVFVGGQEEVTRYAVDLVTQLYARLRERRAAEPEVLRDFLLQCVWSMFAEDLQMLPGQMFTRILDGLHADHQRSSADDLGQLFRYLAEPAPRPDHGMYAGAPYANGGLFQRPAPVHLDPDEVAVLRAAAMQFNWKRVEPSIFGSLLQGALGRERQWALGAHFTAEADILEIVRPSIVDPWRERIAACRTVADVEAAQYDLMHYVVLDPACGSGNFLYVAYRELRRLEAELRRRATDMRRSAGLRDQQTLALYFPLTNIKGIDIDPFAVELARVTMWMGHKLAVDELGIDETVLPLTDLSGIRRGDALANEWPRADAIIGNPPYHGTKFLRAELGDAYVEWLRREFGVGVKDYAVYWFRKAHDRLPSGGRAGLVATNSISEGKNREAALDHIVDTGGAITAAVSNREWSGEAAVHVSIVNWVKNPSPPPQHFQLDNESVSGITTRLTAGADPGLGAPLWQNRERQFYGVVPSGPGFILDPTEAEHLLRRSDARYAEVVKPYLTGDDIAKSPTLAPRRWIIDFGERPLEEAERWPAALAIIRERVKPTRDLHKKSRERMQWWKFSRSVPELFEAIRPLTRFYACPSQGKRFFIVACAANWCPSNLTSVFAFDDDFSLGILMSAIHTRWATDQSTRLETRPRYTKASFDTFPWPPRPADSGVTIAKMARSIDSARRTLCSEHVIGLTQLYNQVDEGAYRALYDLHEELDEAVAAAYGWPASVAGDAIDSNSRLLKLNRAISSGEIDYEPFRT